MNTRVISRKSAFLMRKMCLFSATSTAYTMPPSNPSLFPSPHSAAPASEREARAQVSPYHRGELGPDAGRHHHRLPRLLQHVRTRRHAEVAARRDRPLHRHRDQWPRATQLVRRARPGDAPERWLRKLLGHRHHERSQSGYVWHDSRSYVITVTKYGHTTSSVFSLAFPNICASMNGYEYLSSTLSCPIRPPSLTLHFPYIFYTSLSIWFSVFLSVSFLILVHLTFFLVHALRPFS